MKVAVDSRSGPTICSSSPTSLGVLLLFRPLVNPCRQQVWEARGYVPPLERLPRFWIYVEGVQSSRQNNHSVVFVSGFSEGPIYVCDTRRYWNIDVPLCLYYQNRHAHLLPIDTRIVISDSPIK